jgi:Domain of unknown function (DUF4132)
VWRRYGLGYASPDFSLDTPILRPGDGWYRAVAARLEAEDAVDLRPLAAVLSVDRGARPNRDSDWRRRVHELELKNRRWTTRLLAELLGALAEAVPLVESGDAADGRPLLVGPANTACAVNLVWAGVELNLERKSQTIGRILLRSVSEPWTVHSVRVRNACANALAEIGSRPAVDALAEAARQAQTKAVREQLPLCLDRAATRVEEPPSRVAELHVPHHGLDERGRRALIVHQHRFDLKLFPDGRVGATQRDGEPTPDAAASRVTAAESRAIRATYRKEVARIEALLATERDWDPEDRRRIYLDNPITRAVAGRLIWRHTHQDGRALDRIPGWDRTDAVTHPADGTRDGGDGDSDSDSDSNGPAEDSSYRISLWHPRDADPAMPATWREVCRVRNLVQPFEQVERGFTRVAPESDATEFADHAPATVDAEHFAAAVRRLDWHSRRTRGGARSDSIRLAYRDFPDARVSVVVPCTDSPGPAGAGAVVLGSGWFHRTEDRARTPLPLGAIWPRVYSEAVRDLSILASGNRMPEDEVSDSIG